MQIEDFQVGETLEVRFFDRVEFVAEESDATHFISLFLTQSCANRRRLGGGGGGLGVKLSP